MKDHMSSKCHIQVRKMLHGKLPIEDMAAMKALTSLRTEDVHTG